MGLASRCLALIAVTTVLVAANCPRVGEGIDSGSKCQFKDDGGNFAWIDNRFAINVTQPPPSACPLALTAPNTRINFSSEVTVPNGTLTGVIQYTFRDALTLQLQLSGIGGFGPSAPDGLQHALFADNYPAGRQGNVVTNEDYLETQIPVFSGTGQTAYNTVNLPYKCCTLPQLYVGAISRLRRAKVGRETIIRVFPNLGPGINLTPNYEWYLNGVPQARPGQTPWDPAGIGSANKKTYSAPGTYNWKVVMTWGFPLQTYTMNFTQAVDP
jgi:hypothetical protein